MNNNNVNKVLFGRETIEETNIKGKTQERKFTATHCGFKQETKLKIKWTGAKGEREEFLKYLLLTRFLNRG